MNISTTRFGPVQIEADDILTFPAGVIGLEQCREWVLLADAQNDSLGWLQSTTHPATAFAVVSPRRFVPGYQVRVLRSDLSRLRLDELNDAKVLTIVNRHDQSVTLNLKAPIVINLERRLGRQVVAVGDQPLQHVIQGPAAAWRKSA